MECGICFEASDVWYRSPCEHVICGTCTDSLTRGTNVLVPCPSCRQGCDPKGFRRIFLPVRSQSSGRFSQMEHEVKVAEALLSEERDKSAALRSQIKELEGDHSKSISQAVTRLSDEITQNTTLRSQIEEMEVNHAREISLSEARLLRFQRLAVAHVENFRRAVAALDPPNPTWSPTRASARANNSPTNDTGSNLRPFITEASRIVLPPDLLRRDDGTLGSVSSHTKTVVPSNSDTQSVDRFFVSMGSQPISQEHTAGIRRTRREHFHLRPPPFNPFPQLTYHVAAVLAVIAGFLMAYLLSPPIGF